MSTRAHRRREARRHAKGHLPFDPKPTVGITVGWCEDEASLPEVRQQTHDNLIGLMGEARTGGVCWYTYTGQSAVAVASRLALDTPPEMTEHLAVYRRCRDLLTEFGGHLVVATAEGTGPEGAL